MKKKIKVKNKINLKSEKRFNTKENFQCFYTRVILSDSVYRKDGNYYLKVFLEIFIYNFFLFGSSSLSIRNSFGISVSGNIRKALS